MTKILITEYSDRSSEPNIYPYELTPEQVHLVNWLNERKTQENWTVVEVSPPLHSDREPEKAKATP